VGVLYILQAAEVLLAPAVPAVPAVAEQDNEERPVLQEQQTQVVEVEVAQYPVVTVVVPV
jgi:hypothetical protein